MVIIRFYSPARVKTYPISFKIMARILYFLVSNTHVIYLGHFNDEMTCCLRSLCRTGVRVDFLRQGKLKYLQCNKSSSVRNQRGSVSEKIISNIAFNYS